MLDALPVSEWPLTSGQRKRATQYECDLIFRYDRCLRGNADKLPGYILKIIDDVGYRPVYLGGTTGKFSIIGLTLKESA